jgi:hypothetical protein
MGCGLGGMKSGPLDEKDGSGRFVCLFVFSRDLTGKQITERRERVELTLLWSVQSRRQVICQEMLVSDRWKSMLLG